MKKTPLLLIAFMSLGMITSCGAKTSVSISYTGTEGTAAFAIEEVKSALSRNNIEYIEGKADYNITFAAEYDANLGNEGYKLEVEGKNITITGHDRTGLMYGGLELAEQINLNDGLKNLESKTEAAYTEFRGVSVRPPMDYRTPSYTNNGDSTRWNVENTWDINYWTGLFDIMARMRYNILSFATVNSLPHMVVVPGYENCALEDIYEYTGDYDDSYKGNCTNMYQDKQDEQTRLVKKMTINEKIKFWQDVMQIAHDRGIIWQYSTMNIYTFSEAKAGYGIDSDKYNTVTKDYFTKAYKTLLETYPYIDHIKTTCGENFEYKASEEDVVNQWYRDVYGGAVEQVLDKDPERARRFELGFAGVGNTLLSDNFYSKFSDYKYNLYVNKRYNDTRLLSVNKCTDNVEYVKNMPEGWDMIYNVRAEDCYHLTWANPDWVRTWCKNVVENRVRGWHFAIDGYYVSGKEYEFVDDSMNGDYYYNRHWMMYSMFGRMAYNPEISDDTWTKIVEDHYEDVKNVKAVDATYEAMKIASEIMPNVICQFTPSGTDAAFLPEMCLSNPTLKGFYDIKQFVNSDQADPDGDIYSFKEYAKLFAAGEKNLTKRTPFQVADDLRKIASNTLEKVDEATGLVGSSSVALTNILLDQKIMALLGKYYAQKFEAGMALRLYNDTDDKTYQTQAVEALTKAVDIWKEYAALWSSRFKVERLPRHGVIDPNSFTETVEKDVTTASNWKKKNY